MSDQKIELLEGDECFKCPICGNEIGFSYYTKSVELGCIECDYVGITSIEGLYSIEKMVEIWKEQSKNNSSNWKINISPGQIWLADKDYKYNHGYNGEEAFIVKSKEIDEYWELVSFQNWDFGGTIRNEFTEPEIRQMRYIGHIKEFKTHYKTEYGNIGSPQLNPKAKLNIKENNDVN